MSASRDRISVMDPSKVAPMHPVSYLAVTSTLPNGTGGWFYQVMVKLGAPAQSARDISTLLGPVIDVLLVVLVAALLAHFGARSIRKVIGGFAHKAAGLAGSTRVGARSKTAVSLLANLWRAVVVVIAVFVILGMVGIDLTPLLASATIIGATIGFGAQALVRDYLSGILLAVEDQFAIGDSVAIGTTVGTIEDMTLRVTRIRALDGTIWYVPNGDIRLLGNSSRGVAVAVVDVDIPLPLAKDSVRKTAKGLLDAATLVCNSALFKPGCPGPPQFKGVVATQLQSCTVRVTVQTVPDQRSALEAAIREALIDEVSRTLPSQ